jgi:hypothetical protein
MVGHRPSMQREGSSPVLGRDAPQSKDEDAARGAVRLEPGPARRDAPSGNVKIQGKATHRGWYSLLKACGMMKKDEPPKYPLKSLRHVRASLEIHNGATAKELQLLMGHSSVQITFDVYGHLFKDHAESRAARRPCRAVLRPGTSARRGLHREGWRGIPGHGLATRKPGDVMKIYFLSKSLILKWWLRRDLNPRPKDYDSSEIT